MKKLFLVSLFVGAFSAQANMLDSDCRDAIALAKSQAGNNSILKTLSGLEQKLGEFDAQTVELQKLENGELRDSVLLEHAYTFQDARTLYRKLKDEAFSPAIMEIGTTCTW